jgi:hypothetical protein
MLGVLSQSARAPPTVSTPDNAATLATALIGAASGLRHRAAAKAALDPNALLVSFKVWHGIPDGVPVFYIPAIDSIDEPYLWQVAQWGMNPRKPFSVCMSLRVALLLLFFFSERHSDIGFFVWLLFARYQGRVSVGRSRTGLDRASVRAQSCVGEPSVTGGASVTVLMRRRKRRAKTCPKVHALVCLIVCSFVGVAWLCWFIGSSVALRLVVRKILFVCLFVFVCLSVLCCRFICRSVTQ